MTNPLKERFWSELFATKLKVIVIMTRLAKTHSVVQPESEFWKCRPSVNVVSRKLPSALVALLTSIVRVCENRVAPLYRLCPQSLSLRPRRVVPFEIPMQTASVDVRKLRSALVGACALFAIGKCKNLLAANLAVKPNPTFSLVVRNLAFIGGTVLRSRFWSSNPSYIPQRGLAFSEMFRAKSWNTKSLHFITNIPACAAKHFPNYIRACSILAVKFKNHLFAGKRHKEVCDGNVCIATNIWAL